MRNYKRKKKYIGMEKEVFVAKEIGEIILKLPLEDDGSLLHSTLVRFFHDARGLLYYAKGDNIVCGVYLANGKFYPPETKWGRTVFYCTFLEGIENTVYVAEKEGSQIAELPLEKDGSLLYTTLEKFFPNARGLMYYTQMNTIHGVKLAKGRFFPSLKSCNSAVFYCAFLDTEESTKGSNLDGGHHKVSCVENFESEDDLKSEPTAVENVPLLTSNFQTFQTVKKMIHSENLETNTVKREQPIKYRVQAKKRPHQCNVCGFRFICNRDLRRHNLIHTGEKPFICSVCDQKFNRPDLLKKHIRLRHATAPLY